MRLVLLVLLLTFGAQAGGADGPSAFAFVQRLDAQLPLQTALRDESGRAVRLGDYFGATPVVLVLGYYQCRELCSTVLDGVVESLARAELPPSDYRLVAVSIDPRDGPAAARAKEATYRPLLGGGEAHFLTGTAAATARLAAGVGFPYRWDAEHRQYVHPAGFAVITPKGRIARYFLGVRFAPRDLRLAVVDASGGRVGSPAEALLLLCSHYDPETGRYSVAVMSVVRAVSVALAVLLGGWMWWRRKGRAHKGGRHKGRPG